MRLVTPSFRILPHLEYASMLYLVAEAAGLCYGKEVPREQREDFIRKRVKAKHESVVEHAYLSVLFTVDRGITHELVRHRVASFTQESTRFCSYDKETEEDGAHVTFVMPNWVSDVVNEGTYTLDIQKDDGYMSLVWASTSSGSETYQMDQLPDEVAVWMSQMNSHSEGYLLAKRADAKECPNLHTNNYARGLLPNCTKADIIVTANMREWRHIFRLRALSQTGPAHPQMLEVMVPLLQECKQRFPVFFEDL